MVVVPIAQTGFAVVSILAMFVIIGIPTIVFVGAALGLVGADRARGEGWSPGVFGWTVLTLIAGRRGRTLPTRLVDRSGCSFLGPSSRPIGRPP
jgi:hypothetical protein